MLIHSHTHKHINTLAHAHKQKPIRQTENVSPEIFSSRRAGVVVGDGEVVKETGKEERRRKRG